MKKDIEKIKLLPLVLFLIVFCSGCATHKLWTENVYTTWHSSIQELEEKDLPMYYRTSDEDPGRVPRLLVDLKNTSIPEVWQLSDKSFVDSPGFEPRFFEIWGRDFNKICKEEKIKAIEAELQMATDEYYDGIYRGKCIVFLENGIREYDCCWIWKRFKDFSYYNVMEKSPKLESFKVKIGYSEQVIDWKLVPLKVLATPFTLAFDAVTGHVQVVMYWGLF